MAQVSNLQIRLQSNTTNTFFASWDFNETIKVSSSSTSYVSGFKAGDLVTIKPGAKYYNGVSIPSWVMNDKWYLTQVKGDRAVLGKNQNKTNDICSPIRTTDIVNTKSATTTTTTTSNVHALDNYKVEWHYSTGDGIWFSGTSGSTTEKHHVYGSPPDNAVQIRVKVTPIAKTYKQGNNDVSYFTGTAVSATYNISARPPEIPPSPDVSVKKYELTATVNNITDARTDKIEFQVYKGDSYYKKATVKVASTRASQAFDIVAGDDYRVRCRAINLFNNQEVYSDWTAFTSRVDTIPLSPSSFIACRAETETSVYLEWTAVNRATGYEIEYTTNINYFDKSNSVTSVTGIQNNSYIITGMQSGDEYFFRVRATNSAGESEWMSKSQIKSVIIGKKPAAPTTWSSSTTAKTGDIINLYWVHNAEDGSNEQRAQIELVINGSRQPYIELTNPNFESSADEQRTQSYSLSTSSYGVGAVIQWRVRTAGITNVFGDWSVERTINIYAPPTLRLYLRNVGGSDITTVTGYPFKVQAIAGPTTQTPIGYHLSIISLETYETLDNIGRRKTIKTNEEIFSKYYSNKDNLEVVMTPKDVDLNDSIMYRMSCIVSMDSGLTAEEHLDFTVSWTDEVYDIDAEIYINEVNYSASICPYCRDDDGELLPNVNLSIYRRDFNGTFTEISTDKENTNMTYTIDPHPSLDFARYRIVATSQLTGAISFTDLPGIPVGCKSAIIQWDEEWNDYNRNEFEDEEVVKPWNGSYLELKYNIDVSESNTIDNALVEYIGRRHPTSYYGTQTGESCNWNLEIPKEDTDTLYALRRLSVWMDDVYIREASGIGYWASVSVTIDQTHNTVTIPVSISITRVEGGK